MNYREEVRDLFSVPEEYFLAHCISADFAMGKGIVLEFNKRFDMKRQLRQKYPGYLAGYRQNPAGGDCILEGRVLNLVTKERYLDIFTSRPFPLWRRRCKKCGSSARKRGLPESPCLPSVRGWTGCRGRR